MSSPRRVEQGGSAERATRSSEQLGSVRGAFRVADGVRPDGWYERARLGRRAEQRGFWSKGLRVHLENMVR